MVYVVESMTTGYFMVGTAEWIAAARDSLLEDRFKRRHNREVRAMNRADGGRWSYFPKPYRVLVLEGDEVRAEEIRDRLRGAPGIKVPRNDRPDGGIDLFCVNAGFTEWCRAAGASAWDGKTDAALLRMGGARDEPRVERPAAKLTLTLADRLARRVAR